MGKAIWGAFGPMTGKVGNLVYYRVNGESRVRTIAKITTPPSTGQLRVRQEMKVTNQFLKLLTEVVNIGFGPSARGSRTPFNLATSYTKRHALIGEYPDIAIDYSKLMISQGSAEQADSLTVEPTTEGLHFSWNGSWPDYYLRSEDQSIMLAYFPGQNRVVYELFGSKRSIGIAVLQLPDDLIDQPMVVHFAFVSTDRKAVSDSQYLGWVNGEGYAG